jgi:hypothetical protein
VFHELITWKPADKWMPNPHEIVLARYAEENGESAVITAYRGKTREGGLPVWIDACDGYECDDLDITHWAHLPRGPLG